MKSLNRILPLLKRSGTITRLFAIARQLEKKCLLLRLSGLEAQKSPSIVRDTVAVISEFKPYNPQLVGQPDFDVFLSLAWSGKTLHPRDAMFLIGQHPEILLQNTVFLKLAISGLLQQAEIFFPKGEVARLLFVLEGVEAKNTQRIGSNITISNLRSFDIFNLIRHCSQLSIWQQNYEKSVNLNQQLEKISFALQLLPLTNNEARRIVFQTALYQFFKTAEHSNGFSIFLEELANISVDKNEFSETLNVVLENIKETEELTPKAWEYLFQFIYNRTQQQPVNTQYQTILEYHLTHLYTRMTRAWRSDVENNMRSNHPWQFIWQDWKKHITILGKISQRLFG